MITDFKTLITLCEDELNIRQYNASYQRSILAEWGNLTKWMTLNKFKDFTESIGFQYLDETLGTHISVKGLANGKKLRLRAVRMLSSYQKDGDFEFRTPRIERVFYGDIGNEMLLYLSYLRSEKNLSESTLKNKEQYLYDFFCYLEKKSLKLNNLSVETMEDFFSSMKYSLASRHNCGSALRIYFRYAYENGISKSDSSLLILKDNYNHNCKLPTTYEEDEIRTIISSVERTSATGKRDYLILLLAAEYGWRSNDIVNFQFNQIDWEKNIVCFNQHKTDMAVEYPLLSSIGNAIIDYLKHGRPSTDVQEIIVSTESSKRGRPLSTPTIHSIVTKYMRKANIKNWKNKKHGPHSLRHSLATNMLKKNVSMPIISSVLGHQNTETTKIYLKVDIEKLRLCPLSLPIISSKHYMAGRCKHE
ncbi:tyrosine-type recombinase/integrase [Alkalicella caledoniensis]|uniref:Tyrosine-type recombinase/integrase n=1 Tax=Alkalicella caledoniensis TaxID=2731377 RepID=A0A7G9W3Z1_ALKCA|nr:site-specific integrase [Alkalicella caledoniensis]QNO13368.1 tyrosine-type recombinase/integrase [Alkalicella caledoniensis]QNO13372.1 tyrosine-type recombinase/integrase [Alkalicella caledoniensis]QNO13403.1 tyrosine-type recombinase/integrase [Alkalicella caledoniensis]QNO14362.1 tyrosine-type recombinase/integrase [Alkalicella caledoniensis]